MSRSLTKKPGKRAKKRMAKAIAGKPIWQQNAAISLQGRAKVRERGRFGAASPVVHIDPATGLPREI